MQEIIDSAYNMHFSVCQNLGCLEIKFLILKMMTAAYYTTVYYLFSRPCDFPKVNFNVSKGKHFQFQPSLNSNAYYGPSEHDQFHHLRCDSK